MLFDYGSINGLDGIDRLRQLLLMSFEQLANRVRVLEIECEKLAATLNEVFTMVKEANEDGLWGSADMNAALDSFLASIPIIERG